MFDKKKSELFKVPAMKGTGSFVQTGLKKSAETSSGNGAMKYDTTGNDFVDQFGKLGTYRTERSFADITVDMYRLYSQNPKLAIMFLFFIRIITRVVSLWDGTKTALAQKGAGLKHEAIMRMIWLHLNVPNAFWNNIRLYISISSWRDIFEMLRYDLEYNGWENRKLDWNKFGALILAGLENPKTSELVKKYMPQIQSRSKCTTLHSQANTLIGKWLSSLLFGKENYKEYRKLKASGKAHQWQQLISKKLFDQLDFNTIHGRALLLLTSSKFISNNGLEQRYEEWIKAQPIAKFTGYVHELALKITDHLKPYQKETLNKQFDGLLEIARQNVNVNSGLIVVRDTSTSMCSPIIGQKTISSDIVAQALAIFFSSMLKGKFANAWIEFNNISTMHVYKGNTFIDKWFNTNRPVAGGTDFMSVLHVFTNALKSRIPEEEFPTGILCISDWEFNPASLNKTNVQAFREGLRMAEFSKEYCNNFKIVLWNIPNTFYHQREPHIAFETFGDTKNVFYLSGYDPAILGFLLGGSSGDQKEPETAEQLFNAAMNQEILNMIKI